MAIKAMLAVFARSHPEATFVEIGANDGEQHDHLRSYIRHGRWSGVMVEPVSYVFDRLRQNYGDLDRVELVQAAITERDGPVEFHHLVPPPDDLAAAHLPAWYDGIGSLSRTFVLAHGEHYPDLPARVVTSTVEGLTYASLLERCGFERVDLLLLDTEGADWDILRSIDLSNRPPRVVIYEHFHLSATDRHAAREHLIRLGYETLEEGFDTICLQPEPADDVTRTWRRIRPAVAGVAAYEVQR